MKVLLPLIVCVLAGCNRGPDTKTAVRQGVLDYLSSRSNLNLASMNVDVTSVYFRKDEADALVSFTPKGTEPGTGMQMRYTLRKRGGRWVVTDKAESGSNPHRGAQSDQAPGEGGGNGLPPGHPSMGASPTKPPI